VEEIFLQTLLKSPNAQRVFVIALCTLLSFSALGFMWLFRNLAGDNIPWNRAAIPNLDLTHVALVFSAMLLGVLTHWPGMLHLFAMLGTMAVYGHTRHSLAKQWGLGSPPFLFSFAIALLVLMAIYIPLSITGGLGNWISKELGWPDDAQPAIQYFLKAKGRTEILSLTLLAVVVAPVGEELFFRGLFQPVLKRLIGPWGSIGITSFLFAFAHGHAPTLLPLWMLGLILGVLYETTGSIVPGIMLHGLFNLSTVTLILLVRSMGVST
jgi:membrane protease YdiL (CAAX protease family)